MMKAWISSVITRVSDQGGAPLPPRSSSTRARSFPTSRSGIRSAIIPPTSDRTIPQAAQKGPDARRRPKVAREAYSLYVERATEGANEADGPFSAASVHDDAAGYVDGLSRHVGGAAGGEEADHVRHVLGRLHPSERDLGEALAREFFGRHALERALLPRDERPHIGLDEAGANAVDPDPVSGVGEGETLRDADHGGLARIVGQVVSAADLAGQRGEADDGPPLLRDHGGQDGLAGEEDGLGIDVQDGIPVLLGDLEGQGGPVNARVVDEHVDPA